MSFTPLRDVTRSLSPEAEPFLFPSSPPEKSRCEKTALVAAKFFGGILAVATKAAAVGFCTGAAFSVGVDWEFVPFEEAFGDTRFALGTAKLIGTVVFGCIASGGFFRFPHAGIADPEVRLRSFLAKAIF